MKSLCWMLALGMVVTAAPARADDQEPAKGGEESSAGSSGADEEDQTDHEGHVGKLALGFLGTRFVPAALPAQNAVVIDASGSANVSIEPHEVTVPLFGVRYWLASRVAVELGFGFNVQGGSVEARIPNPDATLSKTVEGSTPSTKAFAGRLAVPLSLYDAAHLNVVVVPEIGIGVTSASYQGYDVATDGAPLDLQLGGFVFGAGARVGAELSLGFIDVPQLSLQTAWGLQFESRRRSGKIGDAEITISEQVVGTSFYGDPWDVFTGSFALYYYF